MKTVSFRTRLSTTLPVNDINQPRVPVFLSGINEAFNHFASVFPLELYDVSNNLVSQRNRTIGWNIDPTNTFTNGGSTTFNAVFNVGPILNSSSVNVTNINSDNRSVYQLMQAIAATSPTLKKIKIRFVPLVPLPGFISFIKNLGRVYVGKNYDPLGDDKAEGNILSMIDFFDPSKYYGSSGDPQQIINAYKTGSNFNGPIEIDVPIDIKLGANTVIGVDGPIYDSGICNQVITLYLN